MLVLNTTPTQNIEISNGGFWIYPDFSQFLFFPNTNWHIVNRTSPSSNASAYTFLGEESETEDVSNFISKNVWFCGVNQTINKVKSVSETFWSKKGFLFWVKPAYSSYTGDTNIDYITKFLCLSWIKGTVWKKIKWCLNINMFVANRGGWNTNTRAYYDAILSVFLKLWKIDNTGVITYWSNNKIAETTVYYKYEGQSTATTNVSIGKNVFSFSIDTEWLQVEETDDIIVYLDTNLNWTKTNNSWNTFNCGFWLEITFGQDGYIGGIGGFSENTDCSPLPMQISIE